MSFGSYSELQTEIQDELDIDETKTIAAIPGRISMVESDFIRTLSLGQMEKRATALTVGGQEELALPSDFVSMRYLQLDSADTQPLVQVSPHVLRSLWPESELGEPVNFSVSGGNLLFGPVPSNEYTARMGYYAFPRLSDTNTSNWVLEDHPDVYQYGTLMRMALFVRDYEAAREYGLTYETAKAGLKSQDRRRRAGTTLQIMADTPRP